MPTPLLSTKLNPPQARAALVPRPRLLQKLAGGLSRRLTLVSAPPGFGKTTLLADWISNVKTFERSNVRVEPSAQSPTSFAWLSLDEGDNDLARFFAYLVAALQKVNPAIGKRLQPLFSSAQLPPLEGLLAELVNDLAAAPDGVVLVLDDYQYIHNEMIHEALQFFTERLPLQTHLVLISREDPPLPLPRLRARGEVVEIREADLRFTVEEAGAFLIQSMGLEISPEGVAGLNLRTEGWIAGLQMAALAIQSPLSQPGVFDVEGFIASLRGNDRFIMDYLMEEVFRRQPADIQEFLLQTSILDRMSASLCEAVVGTCDLWIDQRSNVGRSKDRTFQRLLEHLDRANLFVIPLDNHREWYRYHRLFGDLLRYRLQSSFADRLPNLHRRAALWFARAGDPDDAIRHALAASDFAMAAGLAEQYMLHMLGSSRVATCLKWIEGLPQEMITRRAYLCACCGWVYAITSQAEAARKFVDAGEAALSLYGPVASAPEGRQISPKEVRGHLMAIRAYTDRLLGDFQAAVAHSDQALALLPAEAGSVRCVVSFNLGLLQMQNGDLEMARQSFSWAFESAQRSGDNVYIAISALSLLGNVAAQQGKLGEAGRCYQRAIGIGTVGPGKAVLVPALCYAYGGLVAVHYQRNEITAAGQYLDEAYPLVVQIGQQETIAIACIYYALLAQTRGDFVLAEERLGKAEELLELHPSQGGIRAEFLSARVGLLLARGDAAGAAQLLAQYGVQLETLGDDEGSSGPHAKYLTLPPARLVELLLLARVLLAQGETGPAVELLERLAAAAKAGGSLPVLIETLVFQAVSTGKQPQRAMSYLEQALNLAAGEGYVRPFLNAGASLGKLLRKAIIEDIQAGYAQRLLAALEDQSRRGGKAYRPVEDSASQREEDRSYTHSIVEPLTDRERQVLRLLAAGLSSTEVAGELVLSVSTARSYIKSLYSKLGAHSREEAIEKGRAAGVI